MNWKMLVLLALCASCGQEDGPVTARIGAASFGARASASYFAGTKFLGFIARQEIDGAEIEVRLEGIEAEQVGSFEAGPNEPHEIRLVLGSTMQSTRSRGLGSVELTDFFLEIDRDIGIGEGRIKGTFTARLDGLSLDEGVFDVPVFSSDLCDQGVETRDLFDCP